MRNLTMQTSVTSSHVLMTSSATWDTVHQYSVLSVAVVGMVCSLLTIVVLTRKHVQSPTNTLITSMAFVNLVAMVTVIVFVTCLWKMTDFYTFGRYCTSYELALLHLVVTWMFCVCTISRNCLHIALSAIRYAVMLRRQSTKSFFTHRRAIMLAASITMTILVATVARGMRVFHLEARHAGTDRHSQCYTVVFTDKQTQSKLSGVITLVTVVSVPLFSGFVVWELRKIRKQRHRALRASYFGRTSRDMLRSSKILVGLSVCHTLTETPRLCYHFISKFSFEYVFLCLLLGSIANFVIICTISRSSRNASRDLFVCCKPSRMSSSQRSPQPARSVPVPRRAECIVMEPMPQIAQIVIEPVCHFTEPMPTTPVVTSHLG